MWLLVDGEVEKLIQRRFADVKTQHRPVIRNHNPSCSRPFPHGASVNSVFVSASLRLQDALFHPYYSLLHCAALTPSCCVINNDVISGVFFLYPSAIKYMHALTHSRNFFEPVTLQRSCSDFAMQPLAQLYGAT